MTDTQALARRLPASASKYWSMIAATADGYPPMLASYHDKLTNQKLIFLSPKPSVPRERAQHAGTVCSPDIEQQSPAG